MLLCLQSFYTTLVCTDVFMPIFDIDVTLETTAKETYSIQVVLRALLV